MGNNASARLPLINIYTGRAHASQSVKREAMTHLLQIKHDLLRDFFDDKISIDIRIHQNSNFFPPFVALC